MGLTLRVSDGNGDGGPGRLLIRADDPSLTPYAGLAITGELARRLRLVELVDAELGAVDRVAPVKRRRRGLSSGGLVVSLAECQVAGAECFDDIEDVRADRAGAALRAVAATPSAPTARQLARRFRLRRLLFCVPARIVRSARQTILRLPQDLPPLRRAGFCGHRDCCLDRFFQVIEMVRSVAA